MKQESGRSDNMLDNLMAKAAVEKRILFKEKLATFVRVGFGKQRGSTVLNSPWWLDGRVPRAALRFVLLSSRPSIVYRLPSLPAYQIKCRVFTAQPELREPCVT